MVNIIWEGLLELPEEDLEVMEIQTTYSYTEDGTMKCTFTDSL